MKAVTVLYGGWGAEREVSLRTGGAVAAALNQAGFVATLLDPALATMTGLAKEPPDAVFIALHGPIGEDGCIQGFLEVLGIPYTGSGVLGSALAMDKQKSKDLFIRSNVRTAEHYVVSKSETAKLADLHGEFPFPVFVKPRASGSSAGVGKATSFAELSKLVDEALIHSDSALVEQMVTGRELAVAWFDGRVLGAVEIEPLSGIYDYESKYTPGKTTYHLPPRVSAAELADAEHVTDAACRALNVSGVARADVIVDESGRAFVLEVNTIPGMTETSLVPQIAARAGLSFSELCSSIVRAARLHSGVPVKLLKT